MNNQKYKTKEFKKRKLKRRIIKMVIFIIAILVVLAVFSYISKIEKLLINDIEISEGFHTNSEEIKYKIESSISGNYFFLFPKKNILFFPRDEIYQKIYENNIAIKDVKLKIEAGYKLKVTITEHEPVAKWCVPLNNSVEGTSSEDCFLINYDGVVYGHYNPFIELSSPLIFEVRGNIESSVNPEDEGFLIDISVDNNSEYLGVQENVSEKSDNWPIGIKYIESEMFKNIQVFVGLINENLNIKTTYIKTEDFESFQIRSTTGPYLLVSKFDDPERVFSNLRTVMENEEINKAQFRNLEYVDLRFDNRIYYKIK